MNFLQQITNPLIDNSKNKFRTVVKRQPSNIYGGESFYSKRFTFDVPKNYNNLSGIWIKVSAKTALLTSAIQLYAGDYHFSRVTLQTKNGIEIATNTVDYYDVRSDEIVSSTISQSYANALSPTDDKLTTTTRSFFVPFHSFFTDNKEKSLPTKFMEELELVCLTNSSKEAMGLDQELTYAEYECYFVYYDDVEEKKEFSGKSIEAYNIYSEPIITNTNASTTFSMLLSCPYAVFASHIICREDTIANYTNIDAIKFDIAGNEIINLDDRIIFDLFCSSDTADSVDTNSDVIKHYFYGKKTGFSARHSAEEFITFNGSMYPCNLTLTLNSGSASDKVHVIHEYKYVLQIDASGKIKKLDSDYLIFNKNYHI